METSSQQPNSEGFKDERIHKLKQSLERDFKEMNLAISSVEELIRMFGENVLGFNCAARRYAETLSILLIEATPTPEVNFDVKPETNANNDGGEIRGDTDRPAPPLVLAVDDDPKVPEGTP